MREQEPYGFIRCSEYAKLPSDPEVWLIKPLVPVGGWVNVYGKPKKARKSYWALGAAWAVSTGQDRWLGFDVKKHGPVLYLQADTPRNLWKQRVADIESGGYDLSNVWCADPLRMPFPFNIGYHEEILGDMIAEVREEAGEDPVLIVLDTARKLHTGDENSSQDTTVFMNAFEGATGAEMAKLLVSHDKKGGGMDAKKGDEDDPSDGVDLMEGARGSTGVAGAVDTVVKMTPKGYMWYQGRAVGEERKHLKFSHIHHEGECPHPDSHDCMGYMWEEHIPPEVEEANKLIGLYKKASERSLARMLAKACTMDEEAARSLIRRQKGKGR